MTHVYILTYIDTAAFDAVLHTSAHTSRDLADAYAQNVIFPQLADDVGKDWAHALEYSVKSLKIVG